MKPAEPSVKIAFPLDSQGWHGHLQERLWATPIESGAFVLDNSPFYADGVSYLDTVSANWDGDQLVFAEVIQRGGHSTYRIRLPPDKSHGYSWSFGLLLTSWNAHTRVREEPRDFTRSIFREHRWSMPSTTCYRAWRTLKSLSLMKGTIARQRFRMHRAKLLLRQVRYALRRLKCEFLWASADTSRSEAGIGQ
jgi:Domain of unknown function (DUF4265)